MEGMYSTLISMGFYHVLFWKNLLSLASSWYTMVEWSCCRPPYITFNMGMHCCQSHHLPYCTSLVERLSLFNKTFIRSLSISYSFSSFHLSISLSLNLSLNFSVSISFFHAIFLSFSLSFSFSPSPSPMAASALWCSQSPLHPRWSILRTQV